MTRRGSTSRHRRDATADESPARPAATPPAPARSLPVFALAIFTGAFLVFSVQPIIGKYILPWFGGSPAVWTTCLLFFQALLLGGYAYAHVSIRLLRPRGQMVLHLALLAGAVALLPIVPAEAWKPAGAANPTARILLLLAVTLGLPYLVLSATGPLLQAWFARLNPGHSPYRLFALSNAGSLLALLSYPFLVEPWLGRMAQAMAWSWGMGLFAILCGYCALRAGWGRGDDSGAPRADAKPDERPVDRPTLALWILLPACASVLLLSITGRMSIDIAVVPFLWVLPLSIYLLSFILAFDHPRWYRRPVYAVGFAAMLGLFLYLSAAGRADWSAASQVGIYSALLFFACMLCHGEVARLKPPPARLTGFYLAIAGGGAIGGVLVALVAPMVLTTYLELETALIGLCAMMLLIGWRDPSSSLYRPTPGWGRMVALAVVLIGAWVAAVMSQGLMEDARLVARIRNFYGVLTVEDHRMDEPQRHYRLLRHSGVRHGLQFQHPQRRSEPTAYYDRASGAGLALEHFPRQQNRRIGAVGMGIGTIATYGRAGDTFRFYEIDPDVVLLAQRYFSFLADSAATVEIILGDGRLSMEMEPPQAYDVLVLDAFTGGAVPTHLLTVQFFRECLRHLADDGIIAIHISNAHLDLEPVVARVAAELALPARTLVAPARPEAGVDMSVWMLLGHNEAFFATPQVQRLTQRPRLDERVGLWTDDWTNLFQILRSGGE